MPAEPLLTADPAIRHPLDRLRGLIVRYVAWDGALAAGLFLAGWFWAGLAADYGLFAATGFDWVQDAPKWLRAVALVGLSLVLVVVLVRRVVFRLTKQFTYPALALVLEKRFPAQLGDRLITAVELADVADQERVGYSGDLLRQTIAEARERVATVPVREVFYWRALRRKAGVLAGLFVVCGLTWLVIDTVAHRQFAPGAFVNSAADTAAIWGERNLLLLDTPWPRRAHLELVGFPGDELRVGKDAPPPKVTVRAAEWVIADRSARDGWRQLRWGDLGRLGVDRPTTTIEEGQSVDQVADRPELAGVIDRLTGLAANPWMSRTLRKLAVPPAVTLTYSGIPTPGDPSSGATAGSIRLARDPSGDFSATVGGLTESVTFQVRAEDFRTPRRQITLIPPPRLTRLAYTEARPAYLYHPAPVEPTAADPDPAPDPAALRGLRQLLVERTASPTGDRTVLSVPAGTELTLSGSADKPLKEVRLVPKAGKLPGVAADNPLVVPATDREFAVRFVGEGRITDPLEFDLVLVDPDGVESVRPVFVQTQPDQPPKVELEVDVLRRRKEDGAHLCTATARIPFTKESKVRDDHGLGLAEFRFTVVRQESGALLGLIDLYAAAVGGSVGRLAAGPRQSGRLALVPFVRAADALTRDTPAVVRGKLAVPLADPEPAAGRTVREVGFNPDVDGFDLLDVDAALKGQAERAGRLYQPLAVTDPNAEQPSYLIELELVAADTNVETGPREGRSDAVRLVVVSEPDLLAAIGKDEQGQVNLFDDAIRRVKDAEAKLAQQADKLLSPDPPAEVLRVAQVRADDILLDLGKGREVIGRVVDGFTRLRREVEVNRVGLEPDPQTGRPVSRVGQRYTTAVLTPLEGVLTGELKAAEDAVVGVRDSLAPGRRPDDPSVPLARTALTALMAKLESIRRQFGESLDEKALLAEGQAIKREQDDTAAARRRLLDRLTKSLFSPKLTAGPPVELAKNSRRVMKHPIDWNVFDQGEITVKVEVPADSGLTAPAEFVVKDDRTEVEYELAAGATAGTFAVRVVPSVGDPVTVSVTVK